ncbi:hypothetical protein F5148DRAFT_1234091 [Russula earlei]|uniref:Uncharacterized protein n=1 Tax=Russula earlei TaxID=71964 RepID=A0ACC0U078_9AGAM|nr:hypothetical protein F5148DRAFT_1234091 [Russula earlei]
MITMCFSTVFTFFCLAVGIAPCFALSSRGDQGGFPKEIMTSYPVGSVTPNVPDEQVLLRCLAMQDQIDKAHANPPVPTPSPEENNIQSSGSGSGRGSVPEQGATVPGGATRTSRPRPHRQNRVDDGHTRGSRAGSGGRGSRRALRG